ncbi:MAG: protein kinase [Polyangiaceae bacterium]|nr:protein kinase [Polyangiaceae bacterium]
MRCTACGKDNADDARFCAGCGAPVPTGGGRLVGQVVGGRYHVTREIGEGGMGVVYEAEQRLGTHVRAVALKTLHPELAGNAKQKSRFYRECGVVAQLDHPNVVRVLDFGETPDGTLYIAMELVRGRPLTQLTGDGPAPPARVAHIVGQIAAALDEAHGLGIVHRDLKPDNVLLAARGNDPDCVKLLDFGIAKRADDEPSTRLTEAGVVLGTPPYMSPEQFAGEPLDRRSDVYALGVITYELLAGELPFVASNSVEWAQAHMTQPPRAFAAFAPRVRVPPPVEAVVMRALAKTREVRYATAGELARELERAVIESAGGHVVAGPPAPVGTAVPGLEGAVARTAPSPVAAPPSPLGGGGPGAPLYGGGYPPAPGPAPAPAYPVAIPRPASREASGGGSRGLVVGLALLALATAGAAAVVFVVQSRGSSDPDPLPLPTLGPSTATVAPAGPTGDPPPPTAGTTDTPTTPQPPSTRPRTPGTTPPPASTAPPATTTPPPATTAPPPATTAPPASTTPPPATTSPPASGPTGDAACAAASASAGGGAIESAVSLYQRCQSTGGSPGALAGAKARIAGAAPGAVRSRAFNGNCPGAKSAANAASSIGVSSGQRELERTTCR